jgi:hypothetical protein
MITAALGLDVSKFNKGVADARGAMNSLASQATAFGGPLGTLFGKIDSALGLLGKFGKSPAGAALMGIAAGAAAAGIAMNGMWSAMTRSKELNVMAEQSGLTVRELMTLEKAFGSVGLEAEAIPTIMSQLSSKIEEARKGAGPTAAAFARLGLSVGDLAGMGGLDQLKAISKALKGVSNDTERLALQRAILGRKGAMVLPALEEDKLGKAEKAVAPMADVFDRFGGVFAAFQANVKKLFVSMEPFFLGMASQVVPALVVATENLTSAAPALLQAGITFGTYIAKAVDALDTATKGIQFAMASPAERKQMKEDEFKKWEEARKAQLIPGYAEQTGTTTDAALTFEERMKKVVESYQKPKTQPGGEETGSIPLMGKGADVTAGLSSLAKMGAIGGGGPIIQDPLAMRSVSIQEDIRNYMRDLVNLVKSPENLSIQSSGTGMILAS